MQDEMLDRLNRATFEALESMRKGEVPLLDPAFEPECAYTAAYDTWARVYGVKPHNEQYPSENDLA